MESLKAERGLHSMPPTFPLATKVQHSREGGLEDVGQNWPLLASQHRLTAEDSD